MATTYDTIGILDFPDWTRTNTFPSMTITLKEVIEGVETPIDLTGATIKWVFRYSETGGIVLDRKIGNGITIIDAANGIFRFDEVERLISNYSAGEIVHELKITNSSGFCFSYLKGVWNIKQNIA